MCTFSTTLGGGSISRVSLRGEEVARARAGLSSLTCCALTPCGLTGTTVGTTAGLLDMGDWGREGGGKDGEWGSGWGREGWGVGKWVGEEGREGEWGGGGKDGERGSG